MVASLKILVLNDDSLSATTIYDQVQTQGFKVLNKALTKEIYQRHHSYNSLLSNESCLGEQLVFEPHDLYAPKIQVSPAFLQSLQAFSAAKKALNTQLEQSSAQVSKEQLKNELHHAEQSKADDIQTKDSPLDTFKSSAACGEPLKAEECTWWNHTLFFTLTDYTNLEKDFIRQHFDGIFFFMHHPLGSKALPERLVNLLLSRGELKLWLFNVQLDPKQMNYVFKQLQNQMSIEVLQSLQEIEQRQLQVFLHELMPQAEFVGCLEQATYQQLQSFYLLQRTKTDCDAACNTAPQASCKSLDDSCSTHKSSYKTADLPQPVIGVMHNAYQHLHYVNQVRSLCSTALGLATQFTRDCILSTHPDVLSYENLDPEFVRSLRGGKVSQAPCNTIENEQQESSDKLNKLLNNDAVVSIIQESTVAQYPKRLFSCAVVRGVSSHTSSASTSKNNAASTPQLDAVSAVEYVPHFLISSRYFNFNQILGMEQAGVRLLLQTLASFPRAKISLVFNECVYSWLEPLAKDTILFQNLAELQTRDPFTQAAKNTQELLSSALQSRVVNNLRQHLLASFADVEHWPWTPEQKANLDRVVQRLSSSEDSNIFCYQTLSENVLALPIDLLCSDRQADLIKARSRGIAALELVDSASVRCKSFNQYSAEYLEGFANSCDFEQAAFIRFVIPQLLGNAQHQYNLLLRQQQEQKDIESELAATVQAVLHPEASSSSTQTVLQPESSISTEQSERSSHFGFTYGLSLSWDCIMDSMNYLEHVKGFSNLKEQVAQCFTGHINFLKYLTISFNPLLEQKALAEQSYALVKTAQLSNYTYTKRYNLHYQGLRYMAQLAHAKGFGDGATLAEKLNDCEFASAFMSHRCNVPLHSLKKAAYQWPVFKPLSLSVLSFGCSRGDEIFDLLQLFNGQRLTGIDINQSAILDAQQQLQNLPHIPLDQAADKFSELYTMPLQVFGSSQAESQVSESLIESNAKKSGNKGERTTFASELEESITQAVQQLKDEVFTTPTWSNNKVDFVSGQSTSANPQKAAGQNLLYEAQSQNLRDESLGENLRDQSQTSVDSVKLSEAAKPQLVEYLGAMGLINFVSAQDFFKQHQDHLPQFDVVTVMTVLCRHPDTMHAYSAQGIYSFEEFVHSIEMIDRMVKQGGLLCIFNSNYSLTDTPVGFKYQGVFPQLPGVKADDQNVDLANLAQQYLKDSAQAASQASDASSQAKSAGVTSLASASITALSDSALPLPEGLYKTLKQTNIGEILGHVAMFKPDGKLNPQGRKGCMSIYYKMSV